MIFFLEYLFTPRWIFAVFNKFDIIITNQTDKKTLNKRNPPNPQIVHTMYQFQFSSYTVLVFKCCILNVSINRTVYILFQHSINWLQLEDIFCTIMSWFNLLLFLWPSSMCRSKQIVFAQHLFQRLTHHRQLRTVTVILRVSETFFTDAVENSFLLQSVVQKIRWKVNNFGETPPRNNNTTHIRGFPSLNSRPKNLYFL